MGAVIIAIKGSTAALAASTKERKDKILEISFTVQLLSPSPMVFSIWLRPRKGVYSNVVVIVLGEVLNW